MRPAACGLAAAVLVAGTAGLALPQASVVTGELVAGVVGYRGVLQVEAGQQALADERRATQVWAVRISSSNRTFPELEISLNQASPPHVEQLEQFRAVAVTAQEQAARWAALETAASDVAGAMRLLSPRLMQFVGGREGVVVGVPGMAGTGFMAILPTVEAGYLLELHMGGLERLLTTPQTRAFHEELLRDPGHMLERIARAVDQALAVAAESGASR